MPATAIVVWILCGTMVTFASIAWVMTTWNAWTWPRPAPDPKRVRGAVSVLVPARNEAHRVRACLTAIVADLDANSEVILYDDGSTDGTAELAEEVLGGVNHGRVVRGANKPEGWIGKTHACHRLSQEAQHGQLVFVDADVRLRRGALGALRGRLCQSDVVSAFPAQYMKSAWEKLLLPLLTLTYMAWFPLRWVRTHRRPEFMAVNGQVLAITGEALGRVGGFEAIRGAIVDDMALCSAAKRAGCAVEFVDGFHLATCRMYTGFRDLWQGFSKNLYPGIGGFWGALVVVVVMYSSAFVLPWVAVALCAVGVWCGAVGTGTAGVEAVWFPCALGAVLANVFSMGWVAYRGRAPWWSTVTLPAAVLVFLALALNSARSFHTGRTTWAGRTYDLRSGEGSL